MVSPLFFIPHNSSHLLRRKKTIKGSQPQNDLLRYFQIRHCLVTHQDKIKGAPTNFEQFWIEVVENHLHFKKMTSFLYRRLQMDSADSKWELEANTIIEDEEWGESWMSWHKCLSSH